VRHAPMQPCACCSRVCHAAAAMHALQPCMPVTTARVRRVKGTGCHGRLPGPAGRPPEGAGCLGRSPGPAGRPPEHLPSAGPPLRSQDVVIVASILYLCSPRDRPQHAQAQSPCVQEPRAAGPGTMSGARCSWAWNQVRSQVQLGLEPGQEPGAAAPGTRSGARCSWPRNTQMWQKHS
jgi:hypothetical protein